jgi:hypothetical protein
MAAYCDATLLSADALAFCVKDESNKEMTCQQDDL